MMRLTNNLLLVRSKHIVRLIFVSLLMIVAVGIGTAIAQNDPWVAPEDARKVTNPVKVTPEGLKQAEQLFKVNCALCHGKTGAGDGAAAANFTIRPANFTDAKMMGDATDGELFWKMSNGRGMMPTWKDQLSETQRWLLVNYIRTFAASSGDAKSSDAK